MYTESRPGWDAKNRFNLPYCMPLDWKTFGDAIKAFYGINGRGNPTAKREEQRAKTEHENITPTVSPRNRAEQPEPQNGSENPLLAKVRIRLQESKVSEPEFLNILKTAQIPEAHSAMSLESIPDKPLSLALENWETVTALAEELRAQRTEVA